MKQTGLDNFLMELKSAFSDGIESSMLYDVKC